MIAYSSWTALNPCGKLIFNQVLDHINYGCIYWPVKFYNTSPKTGPNVRGMKLLLRKKLSFFAKRTPLLSTSIFQPTLAPMECSFASFILFLLTLNLSHTHPHSGTYTHAHTLSRTYTHIQLPKRAPAHLPTHLSTHTLASALHLEK